MHGNKIFLVEYSAMVSLFPYGIFGRVITIAMWHTWPCHHPLHQYLYKKNGWGKNIQYMPRKLENERRYKTLKRYKYNNQTWLKG